MGIDLSAIAGNEATTVVTFLGESAKVTYKPSEITSGMIERLDQKADGLANFIATVVLSWEITRGPDPVDPTDVETVKALPLPLLSAIYRQVMKDSANAGEAESNSNDG